MPQRRLLLKRRLICGAIDQAPERRSAWWREAIAMTRLGRLAAFGLHGSHVNSAQCRVIGPAHYTGYGGAISPYFRVSFK